MEKKGKVNKEIDRAAAVRSTGSGPVTNRSISSPPPALPHNDWSLQLYPRQQTGKGEEKKSVMLGKIRHEIDDDDDAIGWFLH